MDSAEEHRKALIKELVGRFGVTRLEVAEEASGLASIEYKDSDECAWTKGDDGYLSLSATPW
ncbi:MAG: hypothetical protein VYE17_11870 [Pseudomonadota bacterium]|nr:hypothetical protein [Pseudomonadota bacterium]